MARKRRRKRGKGKRRKKPCGACKKERKDAGQALKLAVIDGMVFDNAILYAGLEKYKFVANYNLFLSLLTPEEKKTAIDKVTWL